MLTDTLIATVLGLPLSVRLALLDADPTGAGWYVHRTGQMELLPRAETYSKSLRTNI